MKLLEWSKEQKDVWQEWVDSRPKCVQKMCKSHPPDNIYRMKSTGQVVTLLSYFEDGTIRVDISNEHVRQVAFPRQVFGIAIDDLELYKE